MKIYDVTVPIRTGMTVYPGDPEVAVTPFHRISKGDGANVSVLSMGSHTGTHIDPPYHALEDGETVDALPLDVLMGECLVCEIPGVMSISPSDLEAAGIPHGTERVLFKTRNSELWQKPEFQTDFTYLEPDAADWLVRKGVKLVGVDYLSVEKFKSDGHNTHHRLLESEVVVIEGLDLVDVPAGNYRLVCLPLKIAEGDGAPARAVLISD